MPCAIEMSRPRASHSLISSRSRFTFFSVRQISLSIAMGNFLDAVRGDAVPHCNVELGCSTMVAIKMGVEAYRRSKTLLWDPDSERVIEG